MNARQLNMQMTLKSFTFDMSQIFYSASGVVKAKGSLITAWQTV